MVSVERSERPSFLSLLFFWLAFADFFLLLFSGGMHACRLFVASFAVAILAVFVFAGTILVQVLVRMRKRRDRRGVVKSGGAGDGDVLPVQHPMPGQVQTGYA